MFFENDVHLCVFCVEFSVLNTLFIFNFDFITFFLLDLIKKNYNNRLERRWCKARSHFPHLESLVCFFQQLLNCNGRLMSVLYQLIRSKWDWSAVKALFTGPIWFQADSPGPSVIRIKCVWIRSNISASVKQIWDTNSFNKRLTSFHLMYGFKMTLIEKHFLSLSRFVGAVVFPFGYLIRFVSLCAKFFCSFCYSIWCIVFSIESFRLGLVEKRLTCIQMLQRKEIWERERRKKS